MMVDLTGHWFSRERFSDKIYKLKIGSCLFQAHKTKLSAKMGVFSTIGTCIGFGIGTSIGVVIGYYVFIYFQPTHVKDPIIRPLAEQDAKTLQQMLPEIPLWIKNPDFDRWIEQASEPNKEAVIKALLGAKEAMLGIRYHMRLMGEAAGVPIEPESQTKLLDATLNLEGVLLAGVPGAGGFDAVFAVTLGDSSSNVTKIWSSLNVLALLVKEDPYGVFLKRADPRTNEVTSAVSSIHIE
ncbi:hypothetical protein S245_007880 [Arachis hypogaea]|nr:phosphomevalonate kinase, peroxisomal-like isoform X1 [Arachis hypogaea]